MKEVKYKCDECNEKVTEGCIGVEPSSTTSKATTIFFDVVEPASYRLLFCNLSCFSKYYSKVSSLKKVLQEGGILC